MMGRLAVEVALTYEEIAPRQDLHRDDSLRMSRPPSRDSPSSISWFFPFRRAISFSSNMSFSISFDTRFLQIVGREIMIGFVMNATGGRVAPQFGLTAGNPNPPLPKMSGDLIWTFSDLKKNSTFLIFFNFLNILFKSLVCGWVYMSNCKFLYFAVDACQTVQNLLYSYVKGCVLLSWLVSEFKNILWNVWFIHLKL